MNKFGISDMRLSKIKAGYDHKIDDDDIRKIIEYWGAENIEKGYADFQVEDIGMLEISDIPEANEFEDEEAAVMQAIKDGVKIIPVDELPENFKYRWFGWIDTEENRKKIAEYCKMKENALVNISKADVKKIKKIFELCCEVLSNYDDRDDSDVYTHEENELLHELANVANAYDNIV